MHILQMTYIKFRKSKNNGVLNIFNVLYDP
jgi:hypothetical protein